MKATTLSKRRHGSIAVNGRHLEEGKARDSLKALFCSMPMDRGLSKFKSTPYFILWIDFLQWSQLRFLTGTMGKGAGFNANGHDLMDFGPLMKRKPSVGNAASQRQRGRDEKGRTGQGTECHTTWRSSGAPPSSLSSEKGLKKEITLNSYVQEQNYNWSR
eukprot:Gb_32568 [translate_table: standard]